MPLFFHDICLFDDEAGWGQWRQEHQYEHTQFVNIGYQQTPMQFFAPYDLVSWDKASTFTRIWLDTHQVVHQQLRNFTGVTGINLADVDLSKEDEWYTWLDAHREEHAALRQAFGINT